MTWHYAVNGQRHGPVDDAELDRLIAAGVVSGDTPVWHQGLDGWRPLREVRASALLAEAVRTPAPGVAPGAGAAPAPAPAAIVVPPRPRPDPEAEFARVAGRRLAPLSAMQRGIALVLAQPGPTIGVSALIVLMMMASGFVPCVGSLVQLAIVGPLVAAWYGYFLKHIRRQPAALEDVFAVFSSPDLLHMIAVNVILTVIGMLLIVPFVVAVFFTMIGTVAATAAASDGNAALVSMGPLTFIPILVLLPILAAMLYLHVAFMFALPLIHDRGHAFWPAMRLSQRVAHRQLLPMVGLLLLGCPGRAGRRPGPLPGYLRGVARRHGVERLRLRGPLRRSWLFLGSTRARLYWRHGPRLGEQVGRGAAGCGGARARRPAGAGAQRS